MAILWAYLTHQIGGVPFYQLQFAKRNNDERLREELRSIFLLNANRLKRMINPRGFTFFSLFWGFIFGFWGYFAFAHGIEFLEAGFLLVFSAFLVMLLRLKVLSTISSRAPDFDDLYRHVWWHRFWVMILGAFVLFCTSLWGMIFSLQAAL